MEKVNELEEQRGAGETFAKCVLLCNCKTHTTIAQSKNAKCKVVYFYIKKTCSFGGGESLTLSASIARLFFDMISPPPSPSSKAPPPPPLDCNSKLNPSAAAASVSPPRPLLFFVPKKKKDRCFMREREARASAQKIFPFRWFLCFFSPFLSFGGRKMRGNRMFRWLLM